MILPACIMIGFLTAELVEVLGKRLRSRRLAPICTAPAAAGILALALFALGALQSGNIVTLIEPLQAEMTPTALHSQAAAQWLRAHYTGGLLLMESYGNENISFESHIPMQNQVYEGSYRLWQPALANPSGHGIAWIVMRTEQNDRDLVYKHLFGSSLIDGYRLVWRNHDYVIYASSKAISSWHQGRRTADKAAARIGHERKHAKTPQEPPAGAGPRNSCDRAFIAPEGSSFGSGASVRVSGLLVGLAR